MSFRDGDQWTGNENTSGKRYKYCKKKKLLKKHKNEKIFDPKIFFNQNLNLALSNQTTSLWGYRFNQVLYRTYIFKYCITHWWVGHITSLRTGELYSCSLAIPNSKTATQIFLHPKISQSLAAYVSKSLAQWLVHPPAFFQDCCPMKKLKGVFPSLYQQTCTPLI